MKTFFLFSAMFCAVISSSCMSTKASMKEVKLVMSMGFLEGESTYRWSFFWRTDENSPSGWRLPQDCQQAGDGLRFILPIELSQILIEARNLTIVEVGRENSWTQEDFFKFHSMVDKLVDNRYPGNGGYFWELKDWLLHAWLLDGEGQQAGWASILCDPRGIAKTSNPSSRFDALVLNILEATDANRK
jgi:hypothetical protein